MSDYVERIDKAAHEYAKDYIDWPLQVRRMLALAFTHGATFGLGEARAMIRQSKPKGATDE